MTTSGLIINFATADFATVGAKRVGALTKVKWSAYVPECFAVVKPDI